MVKAIVFDWGGVLFENPEDLIKYCADAFGIGENEFSKSFFKFGKDFERGIVDESEIWMKIAESYNKQIPETRSLWEDAFKHIFLTNEKKDMIELVKTIKKKGFKTGFLSNTELPGMKFFEQLEYSNLFDVKVFSCIEGCRKPEKEIYKILIKRLMTDASEILFIDDKDANVYGAKEVGLNSIKFENISQLKKELEKFNVYC